MTESVLYKWTAQEILNPHALIQNCSVIRINTKL